jgi:hypothetical protein
MTTRASKQTSGIRNRRLAFLVCLPFVFIVSSCDLVGEGKAKGVVKQGPQLSVLSEEDIGKVNALVPPDNTYINRGASGLVAVTGKCISGSLAVKIAVATTPISIKVQCAEVDSYFTAMLDLSQSPDGVLTLSIQYLKEVTGSAPLYSVERTLIVDREVLPPFSIPSVLNESEGKVGIDLISNAASYRAIFTPATGGGALAPRESRDGKFDVSDLEHGTSYNVIIHIFDSAGNETVSTNSASFTRSPNSSQPEPPVIVSVAALTSSPATVSSRTPSIVGTAVANATVTLYRTTGGSSMVLATVSADNHGDWSWTSGSSLPVGTYQITAKATDASGNTSAASGAFEMVVLFPIPEAPVISSVGGDLTSPAITNAQRPVVAGSSEAGATVSLYKTFNGVKSVVGTTTSNSAGSWTWTPTSDFAEGSHDITARITRTGGINGFESAPFKLIIDVTPPVDAPSITPATQAYSANFVATLAAASLGGAFLKYRYALDAVSSLTCASSASSVKSSFEVETKVPVYMTDSTTTLRAIACDKAGNASPVASVIYTRAVDPPAPDTTAPTAPIITSVKGSTASSLVLYSDVYGTSGESVFQNFSIDGTAESGSFVRLYANATQFLSADSDGNWTGSAAMLPVGEYSITATATDAAGNESSPSAGRIVRVVGMAQPCGGRTMTVNYYMPGLEDVAPVMGLGPSILLNGTGQSTLSQQTNAISAYGGAVFAGIGVYFKVTNEDGLDKVYSHFGIDTDVPAQTDPYGAGWTLVPNMESTSVMKRFEVNYSNLVNTATAPLSGPALVHLFCPTASGELPHDVLSIEGRFLPPAYMQPVFTGEASCGLGGVPSSFSLMQPAAVTSQMMNTSFATAALPAIPSAGKFTSSEVTGSCFIRNQTDRDDPTGETTYFSRDAWSFAFSDVPQFQLSWSAAAQFMDESNQPTGLWNGLKYGSYVGPTIGYNSVDWRKPVTYWVDSAVDPGFYWRAGYVMYADKQQSDRSNQWWQFSTTQNNPLGNGYFGNVRLHASRLTTFDVDFKSSSVGVATCSCALDATLYPTCRDENDTLRPTVQFKQSTYYTSRNGVACP